MENHKDIRDGVVIGVGLGILFMYIREEFFPTIRGEYLFVVVILGFIWGLYEFYPAAQLLRKIHEKIQQRMWSLSRDWDPTETDIYGLDELGEDIGIRYLHCYLGKNKEPLVVYSVAEYLVADSIKILKKDFEVIAVKRSPGDYTTLELPKNIIEKVLIDDEFGK